MPGRTHEFLPTTFILVASSTPSLGRTESPSRRTAQDRGVLTTGYRLPTTGFQPRNTLTTRTREEEDDDRSHRRGHGGPRRKSSIVNSKARIRTGGTRIPLGENTCHPPLRPPQRPFPLTGPLVMIRRTILLVSAKWSMPSRRNCPSRSKDSRARRPNLDPEPWLAGNWELRTANC